MIGEDSGFTKRVVGRRYSEGGSCFHPGVMVVSKKLPYAAVRQPIDGGDNLHLPTDSPLNVNACGRLETGEIAYEGCNAVHPVHQVSLEALVVISRAEAGHRAAN